MSVGQSQLWSAIADLKKSENVCRLTLTTEQIEQPTILEQEKKQMSSRNLFEASHQQQIP